MIYIKPVGKFSQLRYTIMLRINTDRNELNNVCDSLQMSPVIFSCFVPDPGK